MRRTIQSLDFFLLSCLFLAGGSGQVFPPQNVSLQWINGFVLEVSWEPPDSVTNCTYVVDSIPKGGNTESRTLTSSPMNRTLVMKGGYLNVSVTTICNGSKSAPEVLNVYYPDLVENFECYLDSPTHAGCSWRPLGDTQDFRFFYLLVHDLGRGPAAKLQECSSYLYKDGVKTGCDLEATVFHKIIGLFNGTQNNTLVRNAFVKHLIYNVRPPALTWEVTESPDTFDISWIPPNLLHHADWTYKINYTRCNGTQTFDAKAGTSHQLVRDPHCQNCIAIQAVADKKGHTPWSDKKCYGKMPNPLVFAAVIVPLVIACLAALTFVSCQKNKKNIFPKVPGPKDYISEISNNNNKSTVFNFHVPAEEESCKITLVTDP